MKYFNIGNEDDIAMLQHLEKEKQVTLSKRWTVCHDQKAEKSSVQRKSLHVEIPKDKEVSSPKPRSSVDALTPSGGRKSLATVMKESNARSSLGSAVSGEG